MESLLTLDNVTVQLRDGDTVSEVVRNTHLSLEDGRLYAMTGPNGGGKTSMAKLMMAMLAPTSGRVVLDGADVSPDSVTERARRGIGYAFQHPPRFKGLKVRDLLRMASPGLDDGEMQGLMRRVGLCPEEFLGREVSAGLSGGEVKRIELATLLARDVRVAIYDEPEAGVDLWTSEQLLSLIVRHHLQHRQTTLVITHSKKFLARADELILVADHTVKIKGPTAEVWPFVEGSGACRWRGICGGDPDDPECCR